MVRLSITLHIIILVNISSWNVYAQYSPEFRAYLKQTSNYRELASLAEYDFTQTSDSSFLNSKAYYVLKQEIEDSIYFNINALSGLFVSDTLQARAVAQIYLRKPEVELSLATVEKVSTLLPQCQGIDFGLMNSFINGTMDSLQFCSEHLQNEYETYTKIPYKSPILATGMSVFVPGLGKYYAGYKKQFMPVFLANLFLGAVVWESSKAGYDSPRFIVSSTIFSVFYGGNLWGAWKWAQRRNNDAKKKFIQSADFYFFDQL